MLPVIGIVLVPGILWGWVFYHAQRYKNVYLPLLLFLFLGGMGSGLLALVFNHTVEKYTLFWPESTFPALIVWGKSIPIYGSGFWFLVGINEEFAKLLILLAVVYPSRHLEDPFDGILYAAVVSVGFATMENFYYLDQFGVAVVAVRTMVTIPAHAFMSVPMGYFVAKSRLALDVSRATKYNYYLPMLLVLQGWFFSAILHGSYDFFLSLNLERVAYMQIIIMGGISAWLGRHALQLGRKKILAFKNYRE
ncbi:MAG: PrsW family intramembrane metalloprotease [SAR324 cluster bacterium]|nr:PrsW family intramembrane metalloprotease [SAR324 cluster bacterium]MBL7034854.1 PrsW family intramembrane metalloprotease [SAR324 cluster bacterium]